MVYETNFHPKAPEAPLMAVTIVRSIQAYLFRGSFALGSLLIAAGPADGQSGDVGGRDQIIDGYVKNLAALNLYSPMEPAGSRGSMGIGLGLGAQSTSQTPYDQLHRSEMGLSEEEPRENLSAPKLFLIKGFFLPVDVGITAAAFENSNIMSAGAHIQMTVYESFKMPALSLRLSHAQMIGLESSSLSSNALDVGASLGLLGYFTIYGGAGFARHSATIKLAADHHNDWLLNAAERNNAEANLSVKSEFDDEYQFAGISIRVLPPFISATIETRTSGESLETVSGKLSVGL